MSEPSKSRAARERVRSYRARLRAKGLRPVQIWVPDCRTPERKAEIRRQCRLVANDPDSAETLAFIAAAAAWPDDE
jgi:hypothetical protein